ncbi:MAG: ATP-binding cassette domain-containing protein [Erysipelotrichaceae bacterium]|nr:ATP-binding cassette domain-containing protein [Erysipelotrichaceae bacterium]
MNAIRFENITKTFGKVVANHDVSFALEEGKIYSILGENGSGKTTLMNMIAGIYKQDAGKLYINEEEAEINSPRDAYKYRIGMIHQHFKLVDVFTATENVLLGLTKQDYKLFNKDQKEKGLERIEKYKKMLAEATQKGDAEGIEKAKANIKRYRRYVRRSRGYNIPGAAERIENICSKYGFKVDPYQKVYDMSVSQKQTLEIVKALYRGIDILILDEPTAVLTPQEIKGLFDVLRNMKEAGKTVIIITHKLNEVMEISDQVVVLRKGEYIGTVNTSETNEKELTDMMVGRKVDLKITRNTLSDTPNRLYINNLTVENLDHSLALDDISFVLKSGQILGVAGISGSGQKELLDAIAGLRKYKTGEMIFHNPKKEKPVTLFHHSPKQIKEMSTQGYFHDKNGNKLDLSGKSKKDIIKMVNNEEVIFYEDEVIDLKNKTPLEIRDLGIKLSFVPEDRLGMGLVGSMDLTDNMMLRSFRKGPGIFLNRKKPEELANTIVKDLEVVTPDVHTQVRKLSGGNIQKVLVGREISSSPKVFMAAYPVRGLDINSSYLIYDLLNKQKEKGVAVLFVGEDLDVLMALCDRIMVLSSGKLAGIVDPKVVSKEEIGLLMTKGRAQ